MRWVCYPFHPWYGRQVHVFAQATCHGVPSCDCRLDTEPIRALEIPAWMLDPAACAGMALTAEPRATLAALIQLRQLLDARDPAHAQTISILPPDEEMLMTLEPCTPPAADPTQSPANPPTQAHLPTTTQREVIRLLAQMLLAHAARRPLARPARGGGDHESGDNRVQPHHLQKKAILYFPQSSAFQAAHNRESQAFQYAMRDQLVARGWQDVEVIDEDLGRSAAGHVERTGFERMVAEVCLGRVGAVAVSEVARFTRNSREWQQLVEVCRVSVPAAPMSLLTFNKSGEDGVHAFHVRPAGRCSGQGG